MPVTQRSQIVVIVLPDQPVAPNPELGQVTTERHEGPGLHIRLSHSNQFVTVAGI